jgi:hypothetical protein
MVRKTMGRLETPARHLESLAASSRTAGLMPAVALAEE